MKLNDEEKEQLMADVNDLISGLAALKDDLQDARQRDKPSIQEKIKAKEQEL